MAPRWQLLAPDGTHMTPRCHPTWHPDGIRMAPISLAVLSVWAEHNFATNLPERQARLEKMSVLSVSLTVLPVWVQKKIAKAPRPPI